MDASKPHLKALLSVLGQSSGMRNGRLFSIALATIIVLSGAAFAHDRAYLDAMFGPAPDATRTAPQPALLPQSRHATRPGLVRQEVAYAGEYAPGTIVVDTQNHHLYLVLGEGRALRYGIAVGREGFGFSGTFPVSAKREWPSWTPTPEMHARHPGLPAVVPGGPDNPMGARALYLGDTLYRIHGTNEPWTIGTNVSSGCIRMTNADVTDLYARVAVGAQVVVM